MTVLLLRPNLNHGKYEWENPIIDLLQKAGDSKHVNVSAAALLFVAFTNIFISVSFFVFFY